MTPKAARRYYIQTPSGHHQEVSERAFRAVREFVTVGGTVSHNVGSRISSRWIRDVASVRDRRHDGADPDDLKRAHRRGIHRFVSAANILASLGYRVSAQSPGIDAFVDSISSAYCAPLPHGGYFSLRDEGLFAGPLLTYTVVLSNGQRELYDLSAEGGIMLYSEAAGTSRRVRGDWDLPRERRVFRYERVLNAIQDSGFCDDQRNSTAYTR